ncbi:MAG TPA: hypothetical protein VGB55_06140 [Tepidisphaeraceae bacterium]
MLLLFLLISFFVVILVGTLTRRSRFLRQPRKRREDDEVVKDLLECRCGYRLDNLQLPRCPECGKVVGFDATAEELGLSEEELFRAAQKRRERKMSQQ